MLWEMGGVPSHRPTKAALCRKMEMILTLPTSLMPDLCTQPTDFNLLSRGSIAKLSLSTCEIPFIPLLRSCVMKTAF